MDTTERKCAEQEPERLITTLEAVLDNIAEGVVITDGQGNLVSMNAAALAIHGYQSIEQVCRNTLEFNDTFELFDAAGRSLPMEESPMSRALRGETFSDFEVRVVRKDTGKSWTGSYSGVAARSQSGEASHVVVLRDITERTRAEERLRQTQKLESIGLLAAGAAHDFNNLLTVIMGSASSALAECPACEHSQAVLSAAERASHLTKQLLAYGGKGHTAVRILDLTELVRQSARLVSASVPKRVSLSFNFAGNLPCLEADPSQIEQILMNFIINAGESIPPKRDGRIEISTGSCEVAPAVALAHSKEYDIAAGPFVWLEVRDDGAGMDEATLSRIFDPFFTTKFAGRGLGLAAIHRIVRTYRGFIDVRSSPGAGAAFRVFLPASEKTRATEPASPAPRQQHRDNSTILVADDEEMVRRLACTMLRGHGYELLEARDGKDALEVLGRRPANSGLIECPRTG